MDALIIISATVILTLAMSWGSQKLGVREYMVKSAKRAAQEMVLRDVNPGNSGHTQEHT
jgi:hypothetical protein